MCQTRLFAKLTLFLLPPCNQSDNVLQVCKKKSMLRSPCKICCLKQSNTSFVVQGMSAMTPQCFKTENYVWVPDHLNDKELLNCRACVSHLNMPKER